MKIYLYPNLDKTHCFEYTTATYERLKKNGAQLSMDSCYKDVFGELDITFGNEDDCVKQCDIIVAIGGDGTILNAPSRAVHLKSRYSASTAADLGSWRPLNIHSWNCLTSFSRVITLSADE